VYQAPRQWIETSGVLRYTRLALHGTSCMLCRAESAGSSQRRGVKYRAHLFSKCPCNNALGARSLGPSAPCCPVSLIHSAHLADTCEAGARKVYCHSSHSRKAPGYHRINAGELLKRSCGRAGLRPGTSYRSPRDIASPTGIAPYREAAEPRWVSSAGAWPGPRISAPCSQWQVRM
jgi:hypothetical protein